MQEIKIVSDGGKVILTKVKQFLKRHKDDFIIADGTKDKIIIGAKEAIEE